MAARMAGVPALALLAGVACFASTAGGGARAQTFDEALANAYRDNPRLLAARAELRAVIEEVPEAKSGYRPQLVLTGRSTHNDVDSSVSAEKLDTQEVNLRITQNLYMGGGTSAAVRSALSFVADQRALLLNTEQEVLLDAVTAYMNVLRDQRILEASAANVERLEAQMDATNTRRSVRDATVTDVNQAEARLAGARADFVQARANLQNSVASYVQVIGEVPDLLEPAELPTSRPRWRRRWRTRRCRPCRRGSSERPPMSTWRSPTCCRGWTSSVRRLMSTSRRSSPTGSARPRSA